MTVIELCTSDEHDAAQLRVRDVAKYLERRGARCRYGVHVHIAEPDARYLIRLARNEGADLIVTEAVGTAGWAMDARRHDPRPSAGGADLPDDVALGKRRASMLDGDCSLPFHCKSASWGGGVRWSASQFTVRRHSDQKY